MQQVERFDRPNAVASQVKRLGRSGPRGARQWLFRAVAQDVGRRHSAQVANEAIERFVGDAHAIDVDDGLDEAAGCKKWGERGSLDAGMHAR